MTVHLDRLRQRRDYLSQRIQAKRNVGWETVYDESERDALTWALMTLTRRPPVAPLAMVEDVGGQILREY